MHSNTGEMADQWNKTRWNFVCGATLVLWLYSWGTAVENIWFLGICKVFCHTSELCCCFVFPPRLWKWCQIARQRIYTTPQWRSAFNKNRWKIATLKLSLSHTVKPNQSAALRYGWHLGTNTRKTHFMSSVWFTARMCHYDWNASVCFHMFLAAGHHMFPEQNTACSGCLSGKFNKSHPRSLFGMDGKYPIFQPGGGQRSRCRRLSNTRCWQSADVSRWEENTDRDRSAGGGFEIELFQEDKDMLRFIRHHGITETKRTATAKKKKKKSNKKHTHICA